MKQTPFTLSESFPIAADRMFELWTQPDHLAKWFGPAGVRVVQHTMDLRPGGSYHFCLQGPVGDPLWGKWVFREITPPTRLVWLHSFSDEAGGVSKHPMSPTWPLEIVSTVEFQQLGDMTRVSLHWVTHNASDLEQQTFDDAHASLQMGWGGTMAQLQAYVIGLSH